MDMGCFALDMVSTRIDRILELRICSLDMERVTGRGNPDAEAMKIYSRDNESLTYRGLSYKPFFYYDSDGIVSITFIFTDIINCPDTLESINRYNQKSDGIFSLAIDRRSRLVLQRETRFGKDGMEIDVADELTFAAKAFKNEADSISELIKELKKQNKTIE